MQPLPQAEIKPIRVEYVQTDEQFTQVFLIRTEVFVEEVQIDQEDEYDGFDHLATHFLAYYGEEAAGTARRRRLSTGPFRLERFAVRKEFRGKGIGLALLKAMSQDLPVGQEVVIHALSEMIPYYQRHGFRVLGEPFEEAGLPHVRMHWTIPLSE